MKKNLILSACALAVLTACGGSSESDTSTFQVSAIDGYLANASVSVDTNNDGSCDVTLGRTDENGQLAISTDYADATLCVEAIAGETIDKTRGTITTTFDLKAPAGSNVITPMTNLVVELVESKGISVDEAKNQVVTTLTNTGIEASSDTIFGDFLASESIVNKQIEIISETLVDNSGNIDAQLEVVDQVGELISEAETVEELENTKPVVDVDADGNVTVTPNSRPYSTNAINDLVMELNATAAVITLTEFFTDAEDGQALTFDVSGGGVTLNGSELTLSTATAGEFNVDVYAIDSQGERSYPLNFSFTVNPDNTGSTGVSARYSLVSKHIESVQNAVDKGVAAISRSTITIEDGVCSGEEYLNVWTENVDGDALLTVSDNESFADCPLTGDEELVVIADSYQEEGLTGTVMNIAIKQGENLSNATVNGNYYAVSHFLENSNGDHFTFSSAIQFDQFTFDGQGGCSMSGVQKAYTDFDANSPIVNGPFDNDESFTCPEYSVASNGQFSFEVGTDIKPELQVSADGNVILLSNAYDDGGTGIQQTIMVKQPSNMNNSNINGTYSFQAHHAELLVGPSHGSTVFDSTITFDGQGGCVIAAGTNSGFDPSGFISRNEDAENCSYSVATDGRLTLNGEVTTFAASADANLIIGMSAYGENDHSGTMLAVLVKQ